MGKRLDLHWLLVDILGTKNEPSDKQRVYFQPPPTIFMTYPCIVYSLDAVDEKFAGDILYQGKKRYRITVVDRNPDSLFPDMVAKLPYTSFSSFFVTDNLNHSVYSTYF